MQTIATSSLLRSIFCFTYFGPDVAPRGCPLRSCVKWAVTRFRFLQSMQTYRGEFNLGIRSSAFNPASRGRTGGTAPCRAGPEKTSPCPIIRSLHFGVQRLCGILPQVFSFFAAPLAELFAGAFVYWIYLLVFKFHLFICGVASLFSFRAVLVFLFRRGHFYTLRVARVGGWAGQGCLFSFSSCCAWIS